VALPAGWEEHLKKKVEEQMRRAFWYSFFFITLKPRVE